LAYGSARRQRPQRSGLTIGNRMNANRRRHTTHHAHALHAL
jgi:hypothetical protein